ncbi:hypothetical protein JXA56_00950 [Candidatus Micrarchaeota archaeon]|nr:hypothetical protein [Candidatus Micrarchaeota archaeon]
MVNINREQILKQGYADVKVHVQGLRQNHRLSVMEETTSQGTIKYLVSKLYIPTHEMVRIAEELQFPIKHNTTVVFPKGKIPRDFLEPGKGIIIEPEVVEAEIE